MSRNSPGHGLTEAQTKVDAYAVCVHMCSFEDFDMWCDGRHHSSCALVRPVLFISTTCGIHGKRTYEARFTSSISSFLSPRLMRSRTRARSLV